MRKFYSLFICAFFLINCHTSYAQTSISIDSIGLDSNSIVNPCNKNVDIIVQVTTTGYITSDSVWLHIYFGDGTHDSIEVPIYMGPPQGLYWQFYHTYTIPGIYSPMVIAIGPDGKRDTLIEFNLINTVSCGAINGNIYYDNNNNCIKDAGDFSISYCWVKATNMSNSSVYFASVDILGNYSINLPLSFLYKIEVSTSSLWKMCPTGGLSAVSAPSSGNNIGVQCIPGFDLEGYVMGNSFWGFRVNVSQYFLGKVMNYSCNSQSGSYMIILSDPDLSYVVHPNKPSYASYPTKVSGDTIYFDFSGLTNANVYGPLNFVSFGIKASANAKVGDSLCFDMLVVPTSGDLNPSNNSKSYCLVVQNSKDPNNKFGYPLGLGSDRIIEKGQNLEYTINFQNTGNDTAYNIFIIDSLPEYLDIFTMKILASSHDMNFYYMGENVVKFEFNNIFLPDSNINEPLSHGFVSFIIEQKADLFEGTVIENEAHIFFDYNEAIVTNTERHTIDVVDGLEDYKPHEIDYSLYPNPNNGNVWIELNGTSALLSVYSAYGLKVFEDEILSGKQIIYLNQLPNGIYFVHVSRDNDVSVKKMILSQ